MSGYIPPFSITNKMMAYVSSISEKVGRFNVVRNLESKPHLRKNNKIRSIHSSLKIEANSLSLSQVRDVINGRLVLGEHKEIQEVKNAFAAYSEIPGIDPYSIGELKRVHGIMTKYTVEESGDFRRGEEGVFHGDKCIFVAPPARLVPALMEELFEWMYAYHKEVHPLILSCIFHYEFVFIHPFADGNGRMARLWHTVLLKCWQPIFEFIPMESQIEKFQDEYYDAIAACHRNGNSNVFVEFMLEMIDKILDEVLELNKTSEDDLTEYVRRLLDVMEYDVPYTASAIMEKLHLKSKETFRKNYMDPAMRMGLVTMTLPDTPKSRNQRYVKV